MKILRTRVVTETTGLSRTTLWRLERRGDFPRRVQLGPNSTGWIDSEVEQWIETRPRKSSFGSDQKNSEASRNTSISDNGTDTP